jgi:hypothetical protein
VRVERCVQRGEVELTGADRLADQPLQLAGTLGPREVDDDPRDGGGEKAVVRASLTAIGRHPRPVHPEPGTTRGCMSGVERELDRRRMAA